MGVILGIDSRRSVLRRSVFWFGAIKHGDFRAARLVVDVGIHTKKWTRQQAIDYFLQNTANAPGDIQKEIERYFLWPGQATGYKVGMLKILELHEKAKKS